MAARLRAKENNPFCPGHTQKKKQAAQESCGYTGVSPAEATKMLRWTEHRMDEERPRAPGLLRKEGLGGDTAVCNYQIGGSLRGQINATQRNSE